MDKMVKVRKRNGNIVDFDSTRITNAIIRCMKNIEKDVNIKEEAEKLTNLIVKKVSKTDEIISVNDLHDSVETTLMEKKFYESAKAYILYRNKKNEKRAREKDDKKALLNLEELDPVSEKFSLNSLRVLESRYLIKDENLKVIETPTELFERIATHVASANILYDEKVFDLNAKHEANVDVTELANIFTDYFLKTPEEYESMNLYIGKYRLNGYTLKQLESLFGKLNRENKIKVPFDKILEMIANHEFDSYEKEIKGYFDLMATQKFMPNTPTIINAGRRLGMLSACFILDMNDDLKQIMDTVSNCAIIAKMGGGIGINYSKLREEGAIIRSTSGVSSGPLSFMNIINSIADNIKQGGVRRSALMGILNVSHPDIHKFIHAKETPHVLENFNVSVGTNEEFWKAYKTNTPYELVSPDSKKVKTTLNPRDFVYEIARSAHASAEPGLLFFDVGNKYNIMKPLKGDIMCTNPCFHPDTIVETINGGMKIKDIKSPTYVYSCDIDGKLVIKKASASFITRHNAKTLKITISNGKSLIVTPEHKLLNHKMEWVRANELKVGDDLIALCRARHGARYSGVKLSSEDNRDYKMEHRFVYQYIHGNIDDKYDIHHIDGNTYNNNINNLQILHHNSHAKLTALTQPNNHQIRDLNGRFITHEKSNHGKKILVKMPPHLSSGFNGIPRVVNIEEGPITDVYDITVEDTHNLIADGIVAHNCGEILMYPDEPCTLASINVAKFVKNKLFDFDAFGKVVEISLKFLDNVVDINKYPVEQIDIESWNTRRVGLGVMGVADLLYILNIPYNSEESYKLQEQIAQLMVYKTFEMGIKLAKERGSFPYFDKTLAKDGHIDVIGAYEDPITNIIKLDWNKIRDDVKKFGLRNVSNTTVAPTGSISMIADCSSGIEPLFALAFEKKVTVGDFVYVNPELEKYLKTNDIEYDKDMMNKIAKTGSCQNVNLPQNVKNIFVTAMDIHYIDHVFAQAVWQNWISQSISKTINAKNNSTVDDVLNAYLFAHEINCKGITVYRDGSRHTQVLYTENMEDKKVEPSSYAKQIYDEKMKHFEEIEIKEDKKEKNTIKDTIKSNNKDICPNCKTPTTKIEGCATCYKCGISFC